MNRKNQYPWRLFFFLLGVSLVGVVAIIPYSLALSAEALQKVPLPLPLPVLLAVQLVQNTIFLGVAVGIGLLASRRLGLGAPVLESWLYKRGECVAARAFTASAIAGVAVSAVVIVIAQFIFRPLLSQLPPHPEAAFPLWKRLLACFYGAVDEEILMRLFLLSVLLWLVGKIWPTARSRAAQAAFWTTNIAVALLFGLGHMPAASLIMPINLMTTVYILSLNGIGSLLFGFLFWRHGLEAAMVAHFFADIVLLVIAPAFLR